MKFSGVSFVPWKWDQKNYLYRICDFAIWPNACYATIATKTLEHPLKRKPICSRHTRTYTSLNANSAMSGNYDITFKHSYRDRLIKHIVRFQFSDSNARNMQAITNGKNTTIFPRQWWAYWPLTMPSMPTTIPMQISPFQKHVWFATHQYRLPNNFTIIWKRTSIKTHTVAAFVENVTKCSVCSRYFQFFLVRLDNNFQWNLTIFFHSVISECMKNWIDCKNRSQNGVRFVMRCCQTMLNLWFIWKFTSTGNRSNAMFAEKCLTMLDISRYISIYEPKSTN